ncbi:MAG: 3,4-dihydroxy 2-butanone 4-phosphate synthase [Methanobacteriota archaeon]|jgi:3,4-dihydroxy 2-butanone 4-phosphate synthase|uniref:3,4-dihydroxy-2-butanone 4-phosphate synthase n=1 Tax=Halorutilus salinus TaxID=2487751 RepID=A0A9Q4GHJ1_9EURY|nr:3,4-dihydroxy-2-butanone-4-phosphate synthase [Halorutilus salinus]MCX2819952.1 3,4-dihydroxy-2-butanone-4-phosphate synthase [Halorutilus salinus]
MTEALEDLRDGKPVLVHDFEDRENEVDMVYLAGEVTHDKVARLRNDAGGLVCVAVHPDAARRLGLGYMSDKLAKAGDERLVDADLGYDDRSSFSTWVNHRSTRTGVTDNDRAKTVRRIADAVETVLAGGVFDFPSEFRAPGHVAVLRGHDDLLDGRQGHTEMSLALADEAGEVPATVVCEMLDDETGDAMTVDDARRYADENDLAFLTGEGFARLVH